MLNLLLECLRTKTLLPKVVLFHAKGMRIASYTTHNAFLANLMADELPSMRLLYLGQCVAYYESMEEVPERLLAWEWDDGELDKFCNFQWKKLDPVEVSKAEDELCDSRGREVIPTRGTAASSRQRLRQIIWSGRVSRLGDDEHRPLLWDVHRQNSEHDRDLTRPKREGGREISRPCRALCHQGFKATTSEDNARAVIYGASTASASLGAWLKASDPLLVRIRRTMRELDWMRDLGPHCRKYSGRRRRLGPHRALRRKVREE